MMKPRKRELTRGQQAILWIESLCHRADGTKVKLLDEQKSKLLAIYDGDGAPSVPPDRELQAYMSLLELCGPIAEPQQTLPPVPADVFALALKNVELSEELKPWLAVRKHGITCPSLGTVLPSA